MARRGFLLGATLLAAALAAPPTARAQAYWGQGAAAPVQGDCDDVVQSKLGTQWRSAADAYTRLAASQYTPMPAGGFSGVSCLDKLFNNSIDTIFSVPSLDQILTAIASGVCSFATGLVQQATGMLSQSVSGSLPIGQIIPGVNLGGLGGGISIRPSTGGSGGSLVNIGTTGAMSNLTGYWGGSPGQPAGYGSLFGRGAYGGFSQQATGQGGWFSGLGSLFGR